jgi:hypothetical protein
MFYISSTNNVVLCPMSVLFMSYVCPMYVLCMSYVCPVYVL